MKITDIFKSLSALFSKPAADIKFKTLTEESLLSQIEDARMLLKTTESAWSDLGNKKLDDLFSKAFERLRMDRKIVQAVGRPTSDYIQSMEKSLKGKARSMGLVKAIDHSTKIITNLLQDLVENVDKILANKKSVTINDTQVSHGMFLGTLQAAKMFAEFNGYLLATLGHIVYSKDGKLEIPKYMLIYLAENGQAYLDLINQLSNASGRYSIINEITGIKKAGIDFKFSDSEGIRPNQLFSVLGVENIFLELFSLAIRPIALIGEVYIDMRHQYYESIKEKKKWLESHVSLIKMEMEGVDPNDPTYLKTKKMIAFYEDKISEYDKKLQKYED